MESVDVRVWDIVEEVLRLALTPNLGNPFAVDHEYFNTLSLEASFLQTGAMLEFLIKVYLRKPAFAAQGTTID
jgi:hypothetical protein